MKRTLSIFLAALLLLLSSGIVAQADALKGGAITLDFFDSIHHDTPRSQIVDALKDVGSKIGAGNTFFGVTKLTLEGVPVKRMEVAVSSDTLHIQGLEIFVDVRPTATYTQPGERYDALLAALTKKYGEPVTVRKATCLYRVWDGAELRYYSGRRGQAKKIHLLFRIKPDADGSVTANQESLPVPAPKEFVWGPGIKMGMDRAQVKSLEKGEMERDKGNTLIYQSTMPFWMDAAAKVTYTFDAQGALVEIMARLTKQPYDPNDIIDRYDDVDKSLINHHLGQAEQDGYAHWREGHSYDPLDGSKWLKAVQKGVLAYEQTWTVGGVKIEHALRNEKNKVLQTIWCAVTEP